MAMMSYKYRRGEETRGKFKRNISKMSNSQLFEKIAVIIEIFHKKDLCIIFQMNLKKL